MTTVPLAFRKGHLFFDLNGDAWLIDTGAPASFGRDRAVLLEGHPFPVADSFNGLTADILSDFVGETCSGLIGADILGRFDIRFDVAQSRAEISSEPLELGDDSNSVRCEALMDIPIVEVVIGDSRVRMFFDTGAQYSYWQGDALSGFPSVARVTDFHPSIGRFETDTYLVGARLGWQTFQLRTGRLPDQLGKTLMSANITGIIGNEVFAGHVVTYSPRRLQIQFS